MRKKIISTMLILAFGFMLTFPLTACGQDSTQNPQAAAQQAPELLGSWVLVDIIDPTRDPWDIADELASARFVISFLDLGLSIYLYQLPGEPAPDVMPTAIWAISNDQLEWTSDTTQHTIVFDYSVDGDMLSLYDTEFNETLVWERLPD